MSGPRVYDTAEVRNKQIHRIIGGVPTMAAFAYRHRIGRPYVNASHNQLPYASNFLYMLDRMTNPDYQPNPKLARGIYFWLYLYNLSY